MTDKGITEGFVVLSMSVCLLLFAVSWLHIFSFLSLSLFGDVLLHRILR